MKIFVTGAAGFVGSAVLRVLRERGHEAVGLSMVADDVPIIERNGGKAVVGDLMTPEGREAAVREASNADGVIHAVKVHRVTQPGTATDDPVERERINSDIHGQWDRVDEITVDLLLDVLAGTGKPFVFSSSCAIFGDTGTQVFDETSPVPLDSMYGSWRAKHERKVLEAASRGIRTMALRAAMIYGPHPKGMPLGRPHPAQLHQQLVDAESVGYLGDGEALSTTVHVDDYAELYVLALEMAPPGSVYIGGSENYTRKTLALALSHAYGYGGRVRSWSPEEAHPVLGDGRVMQFFTENHLTTSAKAMRELGWRPKAPGLLAFAIMEEARIYRGAPARPAAPL